MLYRRASQTKKSHTLSERPGARRSVLTWTLFLCMCEIRVGGSSVETRLERGSRMGLAFVFLYKYIWLWGWTVVDEEHCSFHWEVGTHEEAQIIVEIHYYMQSLCASLAATNKVTRPRDSRLSRVGCAADTRRRGDATAQSHPHTHSHTPHAHARAHRRATQICAPSSAVSCMSTTCALNGSPEHSKPRHRWPCFLARLPDGGKSRRCALSCLISPHHAVVPMMDVGERIRLDVKTALVPMPVMTSTSVF